MPAVIKIRDLVKTYEMGSTQVHALGGVNLDIEAGEYVAIMGPSGSGKSTLLNILGCLDVPTAGSYELSQNIVNEMDDDDLARIRNQEIGFVFQTFNLLPRADAQGNVELPLVYSGMPVSERRQRAARSLEAVGLSDRADHRPNELSGGQRQRLAIARAIYLDPPILIFDEATSSLDANSEKQVQEAIEKLHGKRTVIVVAHRLVTVASADYIFVIKDGRLAEEGTHEELRAGNGLYSSLCAKQSLD